ncbi:hypothetical protein EVAR_70567_1 [Eumeta japonica]|uniref:Uncharacterized protein n=1 Tax=Eumeta variegata TaxID=151549 RepID=A0A4C1SXG8_EUMVA|nr:hypothetical protein EVAR_70567_1 [Eumeta japonica]
MRSYDSNSEGLTSKPYADGGAIPASLTSIRVNAHRAALQADCRVPSVCDVETCLFSRSMRWKAPKFKNLSKQRRNRTHRAPYHEYEKCITYKIADCRERSVAVKC